MSLLETLNRLLDEELAQEGITPKLLEMVDLSISYSPVIPFPGGGMDGAVSVRPWGFPIPGVLPERFEVRHPLVTDPVDRAGLEIMRARYLLARDALYGPRVRYLFSQLKGALNDDDCCGRPDRDPASSRRRW